MGPLNRVGSTPRSHRRRADGEEIHNLGDLEDATNLWSRIHEDHFPAGGTALQKRSQTGRIHERNRAEIDLDRRSLRGGVDEFGEGVHHSDVQIAFDDESIARVIGP